MQTRRPLILFFLGLLLSPLAAMGQSGEGSEKEARKKASELFLQGEKYYNLLEYEEALGLYKEAYLLAPEPELLFNIAQCYRQLEKYEEALKSYQTFLRLLPQEDPKRPAIERLISEVEGLQQTGSVASTPPVETPHGKVQGDPGAKTERSSGDPVGGSGVTATTPEDPSDEASRSGSSLYKGFYGAAAGGLAVGLATGGVALFSGLKLKGLQAQNNADPSEAAALFRRVKTFSLIADVAGGAALLSAGLGFVLQKRARGDDLQREAGVSLSPSGLALWGRF